MATTLYLMPEDHRRLRVLAAQEGVALQSLVMDGLDTVLRDRGMELLARWEPRRKKR